MLTSSLRAGARAQPLSAWRISCRPRAVGGLRPAGRPSAPGTSGAGPRTGGCCGCSEAQVGIRGLEPSRPRRSPAAGRGATACGRGILLKVAGSARPPRAWRAYFRMARLSAISASARSARESCVPAAAVRAGSWNADASRPQSSARRISATTASAPGVRPSAPTHTRLLLAAGVERRQRGTILAVRCREIAAGSPPAARRTPGEKSISAGWATDPVLQRALAA